jgi:indolepyruvate ferredoxin oxidoreductase, alpha subunit
MERRPLLGDEALALGAIHAGLSGAYSYPGTPATEIFEFIHHETRKDPPAKDGGVQRVWSANEKVAYEEALGMSYAGRRAIVSFKHVGLNVAADPFMNSAITGIKGGFIVAVADDPGMHSSQNEQDSRVYAGFAIVPCLEPANQQEAYDMALDAYEVSEKFELPIMMRMVTRLAHSRAGVEVGERRAANELSPTTDPKHWTLLPQNARVQYAHHVEKQVDVQAWSESCRWNQLHLNPKGGKTGYIVSGIAKNYFLSNFEEGEELPPYLGIGAYPLPKGLIRKLFEAVDEVVIIEEGYPVIEDAVRGVLDNPVGKKVRGRYDGTVPRVGELDPDVVRAALGKDPIPRQKPPAFTLPGRPPRLCDGCPHIDAFGMIKDLVGEQPQARVFGDIGCYTLGALAPYNAVHSCVDMGASISMAMGAAQAGMRPVMCTIGDSTFMHSGMTPLVGAAQQNTPMTVFILDNSTVAMTGGQLTMQSGEDLLRVVKGLGVDPEHIHVLEMKRKFRDENTEIIRKELAHEGLSVIITVRECVVTAKK